MTSEQRPRIKARSVKASATALPADYAELIHRIKARIATAQTRAALAANRELLRLYWMIGRDLVGAAGRNEYGTRAVERLATDLAAAFPGVQGLSARNLWRMRAFYLAYPSQPILPQPVAEPSEPDLPASVPLVPWMHQVLLLERVKDADERALYARLAMEQGWSRATLTQQIAMGLSRRRGKAITNFARTLPPPQSALAEESLKDPYVFDFLTLTRTTRASGKSSRG
jgi:predicted nuclease of restriction endonuclease-like (RecB) superfamily